MIPDYSPARALLAAARRHPERLSLVDAVTGQEWSVREAADTVARLARAFAEAGIGEGTRIGVVGVNSPWHYIAFVAASWLRAVTVPLSPRMPDSALASMCAQGGVSWVFHDEASSPTALALASAGVHRASFGDLAAWVARAAPMSTAPARCGTELAAILFTSGSTGTPRPVELTHEVMWWGSTNFREGFDYAPTSSVVGVCAPASHIGGFNGTSMDVWTHGGTLVTLGFPGSFDARGVLDAIARYGITMMFAVPAIVRALVEEYEAGGGDLSSWVRPLIGGDAMTADLAEAMRRVGLSPIHVWGMTETSGAGTVATPQCGAPAGSLGVPFPYVDLVVMASPEREAGVGEMGEIWVRGPGVVSGEEWLRTGDLATRDANGWLHMVGRAHRMINTAGELVAPPSVERALRSLDTVSDALVVGLPDERWGQIVAALIVPSPKGRALASSMSADALSEALREALAPWEKVRRIVVVDELPTTATGKPDPLGAVELFSASER
ncbi:class I adenylate-forming enzyme family protein [uncultured Actinomyces sp.]|uniref:class I adenylate-forming enzyme family protein n=1 Tax=uncultured Actinomyces sp. TaxID=249061 RepID=UPI00267179E4|nr:class I adenylate-forming enzyme family protein [uncultured Actinomyces sp.]